MLFRRPFHWNCKHPMTMQLYLTVLYDEKHKKAKDANVCFCKKWQKKEMEIFAFCVITFEPIISKTC